ncbi:uncharacterized protein LOC144862042 [Branchiostoma floridae x Branchiostoma japonicum]
MSQGRFTFDLAYGYLQEADQNTTVCAVDNQVNEYQTSPFSGESTTGSITSSYLDVGRAADMLNSTDADHDHYPPVPVPRQNPTLSSSSFNNTAYAPDSMNDNIYTTVDDGALEDGADANMSSTEDDVYIHVIG